MIRISRYKLSDKVYEKMFELLFEVLGKSRNKQDFLMTIKDVLSPTERIMVSKRIILIYLIMKRIDHKTICHVLKISSATVCKFVLLLENNKGIEKTLNTIIRKDNVKLFFYQLFVDLAPPGKYGVDWKSAWARTFEVNRIKAEGV